MFQQEQIDQQGIEVIPFTIIVNPEVVVTDNSQVIFREGCCSVNGMSAMVPRLKAVKVG